MRTLEGYKYFYRFCGDSRGDYRISSSYINQELDVILKDSYWDKDYEIVIVSDNNDILFYSGFRLLTELVARNFKI